VIHVQAQDRPDRLIRVIFMKISLTLMLILGAVAAIDTESSGAEFDPVPEKAKLVIAGTAFSPSRVIRPGLTGIRVGDRYVGPDESGGLICRERDGSAVWEVRGPDTEEWRAIHADGAEVFYVKMKEEKEGRVVRLDPLTVFRRRLTDGSEGIPLKVGENTAVNDLIAAVSTSPGGVFVLSQTINDIEFYDVAISDYSVTCFDPGTGKQRWKKRFDSDGRSQSPGAALLSPGGPRFAFAGLSLLVPHRDRLIVCAGSAEAILCLRVADGEVQWKTERLWEFRRGFVGPSVWDHFIGRFGSDTDGKRATKSDLSKGIVTRRMNLNNKRSAGPEFEKMLEAEVTHQERIGMELAARCKLVGGPFIVGQGDDARLFVAVSEAEQETEWSGFLSDCIVYEMRIADGEPHAVIRMPHMVIGSLGRADEKGVTWATEKLGIARIQPSEQFSMMGPSGTDRVGDLVSFRLLPKVIEGLPSAKTAWLRTEKHMMNVSLGTRWIAWVPSGGFVEKAGDTDFHFPLALQSKDGTRTIGCLLTLPMGAKIKLPDSNFSVEGNLYVTHGPYQAAIHAVDMERNELRISLGSEFGWSSTLVFRLPDLEVE
jgi:hypothetical protein